MTRSDLSSGSVLSEQTGWNQTDADWQRFLTLEPDGCFVAKLDDQLVGTVTTCVFDHVGWIGMMLVDPNVRSQGIGRALITRAIQYLESQSTDSIRLDATPMGEPLYTSLGFKPQYRLTRFASKVEIPDDGKPIGNWHQPDWNKIAVFDEAITGYNRKKLFRRFSMEPDIRVLVEQDDCEILGFVCARPGRMATYVGPCMVSSSAIGEKIMRQALSQFHGKNVIIDVPNDNRCAFESITSVGFEPMREFVRMCRGKKMLESIDMLWASSGPAKG